MTEFTKAFEAAEIFSSLPKCPVCGKAKDVERFTCPRCEREEICVEHRDEEGNCPDCAKIIVEERAAEQARIEAEERRKRQAEEKKRQKEAERKRIEEERLKRKEEKRKKYEEEERIRKEKEEVEYRRREKERRIQEEIRKEKTKKAVLIALKWSIYISVSIGIIYLIISLVQSFWNSVGYDAWQWCLNHTLALAVINFIFVWPVGVVFYEGIDDSWDGSKVYVAYAVISVIITFISLGVNIYADDHIIESSTIIEITLLLLFSFCFGFIIMFFRLFGWGRTQ